LYLLPTDKKIYNKNVKYIAIFLMLFSAQAFAGLAPSPPGFVNSPNHPMRPSTRSAARQAENTPVDMTGVMSPYQYNMMEPFLNNTMRDRMAPPGYNLAPSQQQVMMQQAPNSSVAPLSAFAVPQAGGETRQQRRAVARGGQRRQAATVPTAARAANTPGGVLNSPPGHRTSNNPNARTAPNTVRAAQKPGTRTGSNQNANRARAASTSSVQGTGQNRTRGVAARSSAGRPSNPNAQGNPNAPSVTPGDITPAQCLANYNSCMDSYCHRPNTPYDRCFCSARLAQIDAGNRPAMEGLTKRLIIHQTGGNISGGMTQEEINKLWDELFGASGANNMEILDNNLRIDWADMESTRRGQQAFVTGDSYCRQNLRGCFYMEDNLRSMYRTTMGQDCKKYENTLRRTRHALELAVRQYEPKSSN